MPVGMRQIGTTGKQLFFAEPVRIQQKDQNSADAGRGEKRVTADGVPRNPEIIMNKVGKPQRGQGSGGGEYDQHDNA